MARRTRIILRGDKQLRANLRAMQKLYTPKFMDDALDYATAPLVRATMNNARPLRDFAGKYIGFPDPATPRKGGHLDEGVVAQPVGGGRRSRTWWVAFGRRAMKLAHLVEFGTKPHFQRRFRGGYMHPGASPHPFFRPAYESTKHEVLRRLAMKVAFSLGTAVASMRISRTK